MFAEDEVQFKNIYFTSIEKQVLTTLLIYLYSDSWELHPYLRRMCRPLKSIHSHPLQGIKLEPL